jgi:hypothetical protein
MSDNVVARWEREVLTRAMGGELYLAGRRAGRSTAGAEWPRVERRRQAILSKGKQATWALFGSQVAERNGGYWAGWVEGYGDRCSQLDNAGAS